MKRSPAPLRAPLLLPLAAPDGTGGSDRRPNIIVVLTDDIGVG